MRSRPAFILGAGLWMAGICYGCDPAGAEPGPSLATAAATAGASPSASTQAVASGHAATGAAPAGSATSQASASPSATAAADETLDSMVKIPAGIFLMGAPAAKGNPEEKPAHEAIVPSFYLDKTEVTVAAYAKCVSTGDCPPAHDTHRFCNVKFEGRQDHPINCVDLTQAAAFCTWAGKRLPTEREWEYAASNGQERRRFSWGDSDPSSEIACYDHPGGSCQVASFEPGAFGLYDMNGNVWEWTGSAFLPYPSHAKLDAVEPKQRYVYRGGSWSRRFPKWLRNLLRNRYQPDKFSAAIGMRCAKTVQPLECPADTEARDGSCVRARGQVLCEPHYAFDGTECVPDVAGETAKQKGTWPPTRNTATVDLSQLDVPQAGPSAEAVTPTITRTRTPQHDADCQRHWPNTPASYLFKGGHNFPSRKPALQSAGCVPRDMGWSWTSACCPG